MVVLYPDIGCEISRPMLGLLKQAILAGDCKEAAYESHSLKGITSLVGATELTRVLQEARY
jgi:hypothetical protein